MILVCIKDTRILWISGTDPLSYALNFDDGENADAQMMSSFSARMSASPLPQRKCVVHRTVAIPEIVACG